MTRAERIVGKAGLQPGEAILLSKESNIFYVSGYAGEGIALIADHYCAIVTDSRYTEAAQRTAPGFEVGEIKTGQSHYQLAAEMLTGQNIHAVRFEVDKVTVAGFERMKKDMPGFTFTELNGEPEYVRRYKEPSELALIREACDISCRALANILPQIKEGMTETDVRIALEFEMLRLGGDGLAFDTIVASGDNGSLPHAVPGPRKLKKGDMITMDFGAKKGGYCADMTRTVSLGEPDPEMKKIYGIVYEAQCAAQDAMHAGLVCSDVDKIARDIIGNAGYGQYFGHGLGHSVGIDIHENPRLSPLCKDVLEENVTMTVEPGIYVPGLGGVRIENTCVVGKDASETLVYAQKELLIL
ncbi:MAG: aminopeptidase P family protein [Clostridia bacterium]|nr:aminopeptidase P family protein [Clostridia bacterium]